MARETRRQLPDDAVLRHRRLGEEIESTWNEPSNRRQPSWEDHADINTVMLATSLAPEGILLLLGFLHLFAQAGGRLHAAQRPSR